jgi:hypothetical protein
MPADLPGRKATTAAILFSVAAGIVGPAQAETLSPAGSAAAPDAAMSAIAPIGVPVGKYLDAPPSAKGPAIDSTKGYRIGTHADVKLEIEFDDDIKAAAREALAGQEYGHTRDPADSGNPWAVAADYTGRVTRVCVTTMARKWTFRIAAFDTFIWDQCRAMEQSLRVD